MKSILLVEDNEELGWVLERWLRKAGHPVVRVPTGAQALEHMSRGAYEVALLDLGLPDGDGLDFLPRLLELDQHCRVVVMTGRDDAKPAVQALRGGATDYLVKPFEEEVLLNSVRRAFEESRLRREVEAVHRARSSDDAVVLGQSPRWKEAARHLEAAASSPRTAVLILGESGTGKEVAASLVHRWSDRSNGPFVAVNAACLPASTLDSELFGHEAGSFTDAKGMRRGLFELADGGTLFLDEIGELPLEIQPKLLRVLEGASFRRVGGERELKTDVRIVAATNRSLEQMVREGRFREDLHWRLKVMEVRLPALRERGDDVRLLALHFLKHFSVQSTPVDDPITVRALDRIVDYGWPGNVRELRNVIERAVVLARGGRIDVVHLPEEIRGRSLNQTPGPNSRPPQVDADVSIEEFVRRHVLSVWRELNRNVTHSAKALGISRVALRRRLVSYGVYDDASE